MIRYPKVCTIGAGIMGHALAAVHAIGGCNVTLTDVREEQLDWAKGRIAALLSDLVAYGVLNANQTADVEARIVYNSSLKDAASKCDLIIEAIVEQPEAKQALFGQLAEIAPAEAVLASNTSFLDVFPLVPEGLRDRTLIVHWYTPPYLIDLVDVVPSPNAREGLATDMVMFLRGIGKKPILLKRFVPGYVANNVQMAIESEIFRLLDQGVADVTDIDDAIRFGLAQRLTMMGQFKKIDYTGLKVVHDSHEAAIYSPPAQPTATPELARNLEQGRSGVLSGGGFYEYEEEPDVYLRRRDSRLAAVKHLISSFDDIL